MEKCPILRGVLISRVWNRGVVVLGEQQRVEVYNFLCLSTHSILSIFSRSQILSLSNSLSLSALSLSLSFPSSLSPFVPLSLCLYSQVKFWSVLTQQCNLNSSYVYHVTGTIQYIISPSSLYIWKEPTTVYPTPTM